MSGAPQRRALFYVFDGGTGVGHLRRQCCIAKQLQGRFACLIVTGHRAVAHWFVPAECEYVHLPAWDSLFAAKAGYWGRMPFIELPRKDAVRLRMEILAGIVRGFQPDVIFIDHLPLGAEEELADILADTPCLKYLITRGVLNETENLSQLILGGKAHAYLKRYYDRILVAADRNVFDFARQYNIDPEIRKKTLHTGYVVEGVAAEVIASMRAERGLRDGYLWVVASAGGGQLGERLIESCLKVARNVGEDAKLSFDIVMGPRSNLVWGGGNRTVIDRGQVRLHKEASNMPQLNASADLVISSGGYNTLLETLHGHADILCFPFRRDVRDEQYQHAMRLGKFVNLDLSTDLSNLPAKFDNAITRLRSARCVDRRSELNLAGAANIEKIVLEDLGNK